MSRWLLAALLFGATEPEGCEPTNYATYGAAEARIWAQQMGYEQVLGVSCSDFDSDADGYVSCALRLASGAPLALECRRSWGHGCKLVPGVRQ